MSEDQLKAFHEAVQADEVLQEKLKAADAEAVVVIAKEAGFTISVEDLEVQASQDLSDEELESVAGGGEVLVNGFPVAGIFPVLVDDLGSKNVGCV